MIFNSRYVFAIDEEVKSDSTAFECQDTFSISRKTNAS